MWTDLMIYFSICCDDLPSKAATSATSQAQPTRQRFSKTNQRSRLPRRRSRRLADTMKRLFVTRSLRVVCEGSPSRQRTKIVETPENDNDGRKQA